MTTIVGINTNIGEEAVILGSDTQMNYFDEDGNVVSKRPMLKMIYGEFWALAYSGGDTDRLRSFYNKLRNPTDKRYKNFGKERLTEMVSRAVNKKRFYEINELNAKYGDAELTNEFIMVINRPKIDLFHIDIFGNLKNSGSENYLVLGSGKDEAKKYIDEYRDGETFESYNIDIEGAVRLCTGALKKAKNDIFSGGPMDLIVIKQGGINSFGRKIKESLENEEKRVLEEIIKSVK